MGECNWPNYKMYEDIYKAYYLQHQTEDLLIF